MCVILWVPNEKLGSLRRNLVESCWQANPDGAGLAWSNGTRVHIAKSLLLESFCDQLEEERALALEAGSGMLVHFRYATHGDKSIENVQPFQVSNQVVFAHNGILNQFGQGKGSDSHDFCEQVLKRLPAGFLSNPGILELLRSAAGEGKFAFLETNNPPTLLPEASWVEVDGIWYSNRSFTWKVDWDDSDAIEWVILTEKDGYYEDEFGELWIEASLPERATCDWCNGEVELGYQHWETLLVLCRKHVVFI